MQITGAKMSESLALNALNKVEYLATQLGRAEAQLEQGYAEFAMVLLDVQEHRYWEGSCESWGDYMKYVADTFKLGRAQLYHKVAVVRQLKGSVSPDALTAMGISRASVLADAHRIHGGLPTNILNITKDAHTVKDLKKALATTLHLPEEEEGEWYDMNFAFYVTPEEKATLQDAERAARTGDPVISNTLKDFQQKKQVALKFAMEFLGSNPTEPLEGPPCADEGLPPADLPEDLDIPF